MLLAGNDDDIHMHIHTHNDYFIVWMLNLQSQPASVLWISMSICYEVKHQRYAISNLIRKCTGLTGNRPRQHYKPYALYQRNKNRYICFGLFVLCTLYSFVKTSLYNINRALSSLYAVRAQPVLPRLPGQTLNTLESLLKGQAGVWSLDRTRLCLWPLPVRCRG